MIPQIPTIIAVAFGFITFATLLLFNWAVRTSPLLSTRKKATPILIGSLIWLFIQGLLAWNNVFTSSLDSTPPKLFLLGFAPVFTLFIWMFNSKNGQEFIDSLPLKQLTYVNIVRIPVELGLFAIYLNGGIPKLMTFEGGNLDIFSGLSAIFVAYFMFNRKTMSRNVFLVWHFVWLALLGNIVTRALLSAPFPFQQLGFEQPNFGILIFPVIWLPTFIVMTVLFGHLVSIRKLLKNNIS